MHYVPERRLATILAYQLRGNPPPLPSLEVGAKSYKGHSNLVKSWTGDRPTDQLE